ncbi:MAG: 2-oxo acid dehydrogenase subunit E2 [Caldilineaceae bacterium]
MPILDIRVPDNIGDAEECVVVTWLKRAGDPVTQDDVLVILQAAKVSFELTAPATGKVLALLAQQGDVVAEQQVIAQLEVEAAQPARVPDPAPATRPSPLATRASPLAKRLAKEQGIDLALVTGSGEDGRISEKDVLAYIAAQKAKTATPPASATNQPLPTREVRASPVAKRIAKEHNIDLALVTGSGEDERISEKDVLAYFDAQTPKAAPVPGAPAPAPAASPAAVIPLRGMRGTIARRMRESLQSTAQLTMSAEIDVTTLVKRRAELKPQLELSYTDLLVKAVTLALPAHPRLNAWVVAEEVRLQSELHIGVAVALEDGLIVPVIRNAERKNLRTLAQENQRLAQQARSNSLKPEEISGSTFTITNLGMYGIDRFTPILNPPEVAILGVGCITERLTRQGDALEWRQFMVLSLTIDHRAVDGAPAAQFLQSLRNGLENPDWVH